MITGTMPDMPTESPQTGHTNGHHPLTPGTRPSPPTSRDTIQNSPAPASPADPAPETPPELAKRPRSKRKTETFLVVVAWLCATGVAAEGAWEFFRDVGFPLPSLIAGFGLFEVTAIALAVMARRRRIDDVDSRWGGAPGVGVWVSVVISGLLASSHEPNGSGKLLRFIAPLASAFVLDMLISGEQGDARERRGKKRKRINFKLSPERILIRLGMADASDRSAEEAARDKAIARVASLCHRAQAPADGWFSARRKRRAGKAYRAALEAANERYGLATNPKLMHQLITSVNLLDGAMDMTSGDAAVGVNPWVTTTAAAAAAKRTVSATSGTSTRANVPASSKAAAPADRRTTADRWDEYQALKASDPDITEVAAALAMGISVTRLNNIKRSIREGGSQS